MITLTEAYVDSVALNAGAIKNGRDLVKKNSFPLLCRSEDDTLLFGECKGSGSEPYRCSVDFLKPESPTFRCSCPSRQFPCKHLLGLMYAYVLGKPFAPAAIPQDIVDKRGKAEKREEKKKDASAQASDQPRKRQTNKSALVKKIAAQLEGIELADKLLAGLVQSGLGAADKKTAQTLGDQAQQLGNYYIPGIQASFFALLLELNADQERETMYTGVIPHLIAIYSLVKKSRDYLKSRMDNLEEVPMETGTALEERIGHAWQLAELREYGLTERDAELLQLSFRSYAEPSRAEFVDEGHWIQLSSGHIHVTRTYRPYRAAKHIREEDSFFQVVRSKELFVYPGELNTRVRWEEASFREPLPEDFRRAQDQARRSYADVVKIVKNQIKNPLSDKNPVMLVAYREVLRIDGQYALVDEQNKQIPLVDIPRLGHATTQLLSLLTQNDLRNGAMLVMFRHDFETNRLTAQPLSIVSSQGVIRLMY
ncbi:SWIM zinc finger family protein [Cohnella endophytica]|uniref:SWIM zinc finger family protein n=1 Tax=Cohnella endophytica TaxID=2419778 RepID=A0A494XPH9_9BACL|nr:SWIM zinc finger family protein [Cohnella endophytica]RKP49964.1 SWIM zinc finger family protein [Cohnella endophytica]